MTWMLRTLGWCVVCVGALALPGGCVFDQSGIRPPLGCGDGVVDGTEYCDGADLGGFTCVSLSLGTGSLTCRADCTLDTTQCSIQAVCGNGALEGTEACDDGNVAACDGCSATCAVEVCGNHVRECEEECDDGNVAPGDGCDASCRYEILPSCGDNNLDAGEECDDGNNDDCDGCAPNCRLEFCGNGTQECAEACDDGNTTSGDGCSSNCLSNETCGNHVQDPGEACDDGNTSSGDGCSSNCLSDETCGNGVTDPGEECDDDNAIDTDSCLTSCVAASCGDGIIYAGVEACELGQPQATCASLGFAGGTIACAEDCLDHDTSGCTGGADGDPCTSNADCLGGICYLESNGFPSGFCTHDCATSSYSCDNGFDCVNVTNTGWRCYKSCSDYNDCRPGYFCRLDLWDENYTICRPLCTSDADCPITGMCDEYRGYCGSQPDMTDGDNGSACFYGSDCRGGVCWVGSDNGYCLSPCNVNAPNCPGDGVCTDLSGSASDLGYCLDGCTNPGDCTRPNYSCVANPIGGADTVCYEN